MTQIRILPAAQRDIDFINAVYMENIEALHGAPRSRETWAGLLAQPDTAYYIVYTTEPVGWFRLDKEAEGLWLGMLQIRPDCQRRGSAGPYWPRRSGWRLNGTTAAWVSTPPRIMGLPRDFIPPAAMR